MALQEYLLQSQPLSIQDVTAHSCFSFSEKPRQLALTNLDCCRNLAGAEVRLADIELDVVFRGSNKSLF